MEPAQGQKQHEANYDNVLQLDSQSQEQKNDGKLGMSYEPLSSFQELGIEDLPLQITQDYIPVSLVHRTCNSIVIEARTRQAQSNSDNSVCIKISATAAKQAQIYAQLDPQQRIAQMYSHVGNCLLMRMYQGSLLSILSASQYVDCLFVLQVMRDCCVALSSLEGRQIIHSDVKPGNILWNRNGQAGSREFYLADFGSSILKQQLQSINNKKSQLGEIGLLCRQTWPYRAPQWYQPNVNISSKIDIWGLGCVVFECLTGKSLLPLQICTQQQYQECMAEFASPATIRTRLERFCTGQQVQLFADILLLLLSSGPELRPGANRLLQIIQQIRLKIKDYEK